MNIALARGIDLHPEPRQVVAIGERRYFFDRLAQAHLSVLKTLETRRRTAQTRSVSCLNRPGIPGGSIPWKRGWSHGEEGNIEAVSA